MERLALFLYDEIPSVPLLREPRQSRGAQIEDERLDHDYPPEWGRCPECAGTGRRASRDGGRSFAHPPMAVLPSDPSLTGYGVTPGPGVWEWIECVQCAGMGSVKAMVRLLAGHRCERCHHPYIPKADAKKLGVERTPYHWSPCDERCRHRGPMRVWTTEGWEEVNPTEEACGSMVHAVDGNAEAEWRILTVHHLDGDKANLKWWNLAALCQRCHLTIQGRVIMERVYPNEHSAWFKIHAAGYYAWCYHHENLTRQQAADRLEELLALERVI